MLFSAVSVLVVAQSSSENPEGLMNNPVHYSPSPLSSLVMATTKLRSKEHEGRNENLKT